MREVWRKKNCHSLAHSENRTGHRALVNDHRKTGLLRYIVVSNLQFDKIHSSQRRSELLAWLLARRPVDARNRKERGERLENGIAALVNDKLLRTRFDADAYCRQQSR